jgi:hypothetical protein
LFCRQKKHTTNPETCFFARVPIIVNFPGHHTYWRRNRSGFCHLCLSAIQTYRLYMHTMPAGMYVDSIHRITICSNYIQLAQSQSHHTFARFADQRLCLVSIRHITAKTTAPVRLSFALVARISSRMLLLDSASSLSQSVSVRTPYEAPTS